MIWLVFVVIGAAHLFFMTQGMAPADFISKALLMPIAALALYRDTKPQSKIVRWVIIGLLFGWVGDVMLHFHAFHFFIIGLIAFLAGHIFYIRAFGKEVSEHKVVHFVMEKPYLILPYICFFIYIIVLMNPVLESVMKVPVFLYCFVILVMSLMAINRFHVAKKTSWLLVWIGSILFVVSDFVLAMNKFVGQIEFASLIIMSTYIAGQGLIAYGISRAYRS